MANLGFAKTTMLLLLIGCSAFCAAQKERFFRAECGTSAGYIRLAKDGRYNVIWREHTGIFPQDRGTWKQNGAVISFSPTDPRSVPYEGMLTVYLGKIFLSWTSNHAPGIVIPAAATKKELDVDSSVLPEYVFFETSGKIYEMETRKTYPFRYLQRQP